MSIEIYQNTLGEDCVSWVNEDGSGGSMLKSVYDEMQAKQNEGMSK